MDVTLKTFQVNQVKMKKDSSLELVCLPGLLIAFN